MGLPVKLLEQVKLLFTEGKSDKVYEVDLLEVRPGQAVVNFRYGRRGTQLKDGSKTPVPLPTEEARRVFERLVQSKLDSGYVREGSPSAPATPRAASAPTPPPAPVARADASARERKLLEQLTQEQQTRRWFRRTEVRANARPLERIIWSLGEQRVRAAEPVLLNLLERAEPLRAYCIVAALGRLGSAASVSTLGRLYGDSSAHPMVRRMATEALLQLSDEATRAEFRQDMVGRLPLPLREPARGSDPQALASALEAYLSAGDSNAPAALEQLYLVDSPTVRPALLQALRTVPFTPHAVRALRHVFKAAEYRGDGEVFGLLARRYERERPTGAPGGLTATTRHYLRRRVWRTLRRLGELESPDFVRMAVGVLLAYSDQDAVPVRATGWGRNERKFDGFAPYWAFNQLLYRHSRRYTQHRSSLTFRMQPGHQPGESVPGHTREEAFPRLWERTPEGLLHLLDESRCAPVHAFAARALRACPDFLARLDTEAVAMLLERAYEPTAELGLELALKRLDVRREPRALLLAMARSPYEPARRKAFQLMDEVRATLAQDGAFLAALATAPHADTRAYVRQVVRSTYLPESVARALTGRLLAALVPLKAKEEGPIAADMAQVVLALLGPGVPVPGAEVVQELLAHPLAEVQELGGELLLRRDWRTEPVPEPLLRTLLESEHAPVRATGLRLLGLLASSEPVLLAQEELLTRMATHRAVDVRTAVRPLIVRLCGMSPEAGQRVARGLVAALLRRRLPEEVPAHVVSLLRVELAGALAALPREEVWRLLDSEDGDAQVLGAELLARWGAELQVDVARVVRLANHEVLAVREWARRWLEAHVPQVRAELATAVGLLDGRWEDTREWGSAYFRERFAPEDFSLEVLVSVADSVHAPVQAYGCELLTRSFREEEGPELLLRLSEHPAPAVQLFATHYLERFATGRPELVERLESYFLRVLGQINRGRVARQRVLGFLRHQGRQDERSARVAMGVLHRLSATIAVEHKAAALEAMLAIGKAQPAVPLPFKVLPVEVRRAV